MDLNLMPDGQGFEVTAYFTFSLLFKQLFGSCSSEPEDPERFQTIPAPTGDSVSSQILRHWLIPLVVKFFTGALIGLIVHKIVNKLAKRTQKNPDEKNRRCTLPDQMDLVDLDDIDVSESAHEQNMKKAMSMLSLITSPGDTSSFHLAGTFTEEHNLALDLALSFDHDSIDYGSAEQTPQSTNNSTNNSSSNGSSSFAVATPGKEKVENATIESLEEPTSLQEGMMNVKAVARLFEHSFNAKGATASSRVPKPKVPTTPRYHRRSCAGRVGDSRWEAFESTTPRKCAVIHSPHAPINAASGDREMQNKSREVNKDVEVIEERKGGVVGDVNERGDTQVRPQNWTTSENDIVSETTEWVVYSE